ncbi:MAG: calcium/sodium antiporter [Flavobacteriales bacterium]|nr:calcium/sodium antiporter [Flavobacteriales bacterium]
MIELWEGILNNPYVLLLGGVVLLALGGETLVRNATGLALKSNISPLIVGLTVVAIGTSSPELFASLQAAWNDASGIVVGNVVGSNIANLGLALGLTALVRPMTIDKEHVTFDWSILMVVTVLFGVLALDGVYSRVDGVVFLGVMAVIMFGQVLRSRKMKLAQVASKKPSEDLIGFNQYAGRNYTVLFLWITAGCVLLYYGAGLFIDGASDLARNFSISEHVIGLTVVAFGTSIPEIVASVTAALKGQSELSIGNIIGSNIMNILFVLGITTTVSEVDIDPSMITGDFWWMLGTTALLYPILTIGKKVSRVHGAIYLSCYIIYVWLALA